MSAPLALPKSGQKISCYFRQRKGTKEPGIGSECPSIRPKSLDFTLDSLGNRIGEKIGRNTSFPDVKMPYIKQLHLFVDRHA
jgi:hypothetical protein